MDKQNLTDLLKTEVHSQSLISAILSIPQSKKYSTQKVTIRPIKQKNGVVYQVTEQRGAQVFHRNLTPDLITVWIEHEFTNHFKQLNLYCGSHDYLVMEGKIIQKPASKKLTVVENHNRSKNYLFADGIPNPVLISLGVMKPDGTVISSARDKFKQVNRYLETIQDTLKHLSQDKELFIIDYGCGSALLTFALYYFLREIKGLKITMQGLDLKKEVIAKCSALAQELKFADLHFKVEDINHHHPDHAVDMVISLHACDTATDAALERGVRWNAKVILAVPCCQHELFAQIDNPALKPLLKFGIVKERLAALATDAARAQILKLLGYQSEIVEFIDMEHTPKNLLIRAVRTDKPGSKKDRAEYLAYKQALNIAPSLELRFIKELELI